MTLEQRNYNWILQLVDNGFNAAKGIDYRKAHFILFNKQADNCSCNDGKIFIGVRTEIYRLKALKDEIKQE